MTNDEFSVFFYTTCENKQSIVQLPLKELRLYKRWFFNVDVPEWRLNLIWEYLWNYRTFDELVFIFKNKKII